MNLSVSVNVGQCWLMSYGLLFCWFVFDTVRNVWHVLGMIIGSCLSDLFNSMENSVHGKSVSNIGHLLSFCRQLG